MTTSTTFDPTRIAAIPGSAASFGTAATRLEIEPLGAVKVKTATGQRHSKKIAQNAAKRVETLKRAFQAIDDAETHGIERPAFVLNLKGEVVALLAGKNRA